MNRKTFSNIRLFALIGTLLLTLNTACRTQKNRSGAVGKQEFKILTYNIHHANPPSKPGFIDIDAICRVIRESDADVVALQEVDVYTNRSGKIDEAKQIAKELDMHYHFFKAIDHDGGEYGLAILSKLPVRNPENIPLPQVEKAEGRTLALLQVKVGNSWIYVANTHLDASRPDRNRVAQMQFIVDKTSGLDLPVILCGDLNSTPASETIRILDTHFKRTCIDDCLPTSPQANPRRTIDYIATRNIPWQQKSIEVIAETYASDHRPVKVTFHMD